MKIVWCLVCGEFFSPDRDGAWRFCPMPCAHTGVRWADARTGQLEVSYFHGPDDMRVIGLDNMFLQLATGDIRPGSDERWRELHDAVTTKVADHYLFHSSHRSCWALLVRAGESGDVKVVPYNEAHNAYLDVGRVQAPKEHDG